jgi:hypothetical protein
LFFSLAVKGSFLSESSRFDPVDGYSSWFVRERLKWLIPVRWLNKLGVRPTINLKLLILIFGKREQSRRRPRGDVDRRYQDSGRCGAGYTRRFDAHSNNQFLRSIQQVI